MRIVKRFAQGDTVQVQKHLDSSECERLIQANKANQILLQEIYGFWILCDCNVPATVKCFKDTNHFFIAKIPNRGKHETTCPLYSVTENAANPNTALVKPTGTSFSFSLLSTDGDTTRTIVRQNDGATKVGRSDKLYSLCAQLFTDAKVNQLKYGQFVSFEEQSKKLKHAAKRYNLGGKSLFQYIRFSMGELKSIRDELESRETTWVGRHKPQCLLIAHVDGMTRQDATWSIRVREGWDVKLAPMTQVTRLNGAFNISKGPLVVCCIVAELPMKVQKEHGRFGISRVFVSPCVNDTGYVLVDSDLERTFARCCIKMLLNRQAPHTIVKPLIPHYVDGIPILPDFVVQHDNEKTVVEVMGKYDEPEYRERKERVVAKMKGLYTDVRSVGELTAKDKNAFYTESMDILGELLRDSGQA